MSAVFLHIVETGMMCVLVALFVWIYARERQPRLALWITGWTFVVVHFACGIVAANPRYAGPLFDWIAYATLLISGTSFIFSVSQACRNLRHRIPELQYFLAGQHRLQLCERRKGMLLDHFFLILQ